MRIYYDLEANGLYNRLGPRARNTLDKTKSLIIQRLKVLEEEINAENGEIILRLLSQPPGIEYKYFSRPLLDKMKNCISEDDFAFLFGQLGI